MKIKFIWLILNCLIVVSLLIASCGGGGGEEQQEQEQQEQEQQEQEQQEQEQQAKEEKEEVVTTEEGPSYGGTLTVISPDYVSDDPADAITQTMQQNSFMNEPLLIGHWEWPTEKCGFFGTEMNSVTEPEEKLVGNLAESFELVGEDTLLYHIRKGVRWNAGLPEARKLVGDREFEASDVEKYFDYLINSPKQRARFSAIESVKAIDKYTVEVKSKEPDIFLTDSTGRGPYTAIQCPEVLEKYGDYKDWKVNVGTGPFIRVDLVPGSLALFERNPNYWNTDVKNPDYQIPYIDRVKVLFLTDVATELAAFRTGKIDILYGSGMTRQHLADLLKTNPDTGVARFCTSNSFWSLRTDIEPFNDIRVRKAMNMAVNRQEILDGFYEGEGILWSMPYPPIYWETYMPFDTLPDDIKEIYTYNPEGAKKLLAEAGYPDGFKTSLVYYAPSGSEYHEKNALIASYLEKVGIDVELRLVDAGTNNSMRYGFSYPGMYGDNMGINYPEYHYFVWAKSDAPWNRCRINDPYIDETINKGLSTFDKEARRALYRELDYYYLRHCYALAPVNGYNYTVWNPWVKSYAGQVSLYGQDRAQVYSRVWLDRDMKEEYTGSR